MSRLVLVASFPVPRGLPRRPRRLPSACACGDDQPVALIEVGGAPSRADDAGELLGARRSRSACARPGATAAPAAASPRFRWSSPRAGRTSWSRRSRSSTETESAVVSLPPALLRRVLARAELGVEAVLLRAELPRQRALAALAVAELRAPGVAVKDRAPSARAGGAPVARSPGSIPGETRRRGRRGWRRRCSAPAGDVARDGRREPALAAETGQALPLVLGGVAGADRRHPGARGLRRGGHRQVADAARRRPGGPLGGALDARRLRPPVRPGSPARRLAEPRAPGEGGVPGSGRGRRARRRRGATASTPAGSRSSSPTVSRSPRCGSGREVEAELETPGDLPRVPVTARAEAEAVPPATPASGAGSGRRQRRRLLRSARVPPGRGDAARRRRRLRPDGRRGRAPTASRC